MRDLIMGWVSGGMAMTFQRVLQRQCGIKCDMICSLSSTTLSTSMNIMTMRVDRWETKPRFGIRAVTDFGPDGPRSTVRKRP